MSLTGHNHGHDPWAQASGEGLGCRVNLSHGFIFSTGHDHGHDHGHKHEEREEVEKKAIKDEGDDAEKSRFIEALIKVALISPRPSLPFHPAPQQFIWNSHNLTWFPPLSQ